VAAPTEEQRHGLVDPPAEERKEWRPEEQELDVHVDRACLCETLGGWRLAEAEVNLQRLADKKGDSDGSVCREGHDWEKDDAEPPRERATSYLILLCAIRREKNERTLPQCCSVRERILYFRRAMGVAVGTSVWSCGEEEKTHKLGHDAHERYANAQ
jgi:hypothetical protein